MGDSLSSLRKKSSVQTNMVTLAIVTSSIIIAVNIVLFVFISRSMEVVNRVYSTNVAIGELSETLAKVRSSMTDYLNTKSTDSMEQYYDAVGQYRDCLAELSVRGQGRDNAAILEDIEGLSDTYLEVTEDTIQAKRGRVVEKYNTAFERSEGIYSYINAYIYSLNNEQFKRNSENYAALRTTLWSLAVVTMSVIVAVFVPATVTVAPMTGSPSSSST